MADSHTQFLAKIVTLFPHNFFHDQILISTQFFNKIDLHLQTCTVHLYSHSLTCLKPLFLKSFKQSLP